MQVRVEEDLRDWLEYSEEGSKKALALGNRGPVKLDDNGNLDPLIIELISAQVSMSLPMFSVMKKWKI